MLNRVLFPSGPGHGIYFFILHINPHLDSDCSKPISTASPCITQETFKKFLCYNRFVSGCTALWWDKKIIIVLLFLWVHIVLECTDKVFIVLMIFLCLLNFHVCHIKKVCDITHCYLSLQTQPADISRKIITYALKGYLQQRLTS